MLDIAGLLPTFSEIQQTIQHITFTELQQQYCCRQVGKHNSTPVDEEEKLNFSRDKNARHEPWWVGGEKSLLCDPGFEVRLGGREQKGEDNKWDAGRPGDSFTSKYSG